jgi:hypothetical protein
MKNDINSKFYNTIALVTISNFQNNFLANRLAFLQNQLKSFVGITGIPESKNKKRRSRFDTESPPFADKSKIY